MIHFLCWLKISLFHFLLFEKEKLYSFHRLGATGTTFDRCLEERLIFAQFLTNFDMIFTLETCAFVNYFVMMVQAKDHLDSYQTCLTVEPPNLKDHLPLPNCK